MESECLHNDEDCAGGVHRSPEPSLAGKYYDYCEYHMEEWLSLLRSYRRTYESATPPAWFDPDYAGERWNEDD